MRHPLRAHAIALWCCAPILLWLSTYRPEGGDRGRAARVPAELAGFEQVEEYPLTESVAAMLGTPDATWRRYRERGADEEVYVVAVFHDENWKSVHAPVTCLQGSNMEVVDETTWHTRALDGEDREIGYLRMHSLDRGDDYLSLFVFLSAPDFASGSYWSFFFHHAPSALLRRSVAGCLLRVETWVPAGGRDAAEARCSRVMDALIPASRELLR